MKKNDIDPFHEPFTFLIPGFNLRSTDLQAYIGLSQIDKLNDWGEIRESNYELYQQLIENDYYRPSCSRAQSQKRAMT